MAKTNGVPPVGPKSTKGMNLGQLWYQIMIREYFTESLRGYTISVQELAPAMKSQLDNLLDQINYISGEIGSLATKMGNPIPNPDNDPKITAENRARENMLQAKVNALTTERSVIQTRVSTATATLQSVLQRGMSFLQQANQFTAEIGQIWNQMSGTMAA